MGHLVKGDGADTISQSWNVPGSLNLGCFTNGLFSERFRVVFFVFVFLPKTLKVVSIVRLVNILPGALQKSQVRWFVLAC